MSAPAWQADKRWSDQFIPAIQIVLGSCFVSVAPEYEDTQENTDLMVFSVLPVRVACRVRNMKYCDDHDYAHQFTIRCERPTGAKTEFEKICDGFGDYFLYGFGDESTRMLRKWVLVDLKAFRSYLIRHTIQHPAVRPWHDQRTNRDGTKFKAFDTTRLPVSCVRDRFNWTWIPPEEQSDIPF